MTDIVERLRAAYADTSNLTFKLAADEIERLRDAAMDALSGWRYIRATHGDLHGVGWDRVEQKLVAALGEAKDE